MVKKIIPLVVLLALLVTDYGAPAASAAPYNSYTYSYWGEAVPSPAAYAPYRDVTGDDLGAGAFNAPTDLFVDHNGFIYILDSGNNRIVIADSNWKLVREISVLRNQGSEDRLNNPQGIFVTRGGSIYVADTQNKRIVELTQEGEVVRVIGAPESDVIRAGFEYYPLKLAVDKANRIYVVGRGVFDGLIEFDADGRFTRFTGANRVNFDPLDYFWKRISTSAQRSSLIQFIPIEFSNLDLDGSGFIYTTTSEQNAFAPIKRLNPSGIDVLRREGYYSPRGDLEYPYVGANSGSSIFIDIDVNEFGMYSALDIKRGRIFTYNNDGDLLHVFGKTGKQTGTFKVPIALERLGEEMLVLDRDLNQITLFQPTRFGKAVNEAVRLYYEGQEEKSAEAWEEVLRLNANYDIAYTGIGKALLRQERHDEAMEYFQIGMNRQYHSKAFERYREELFFEHFGNVMTILTALALIGFAIRWLMRRKARVNGHVDRTT